MASEPGTCRVPPVDVQRGLYLACTGSSVAAAAALGICCLRLWPKHRDQLLLRQLLCLAGADLSLGLVNGWIPAARLLFGLAHISDFGCAVESFLHKFLLMTSVLLSLALALTLLFQLQKRPAPRWLRWATVLALPTSGALCVPMLIWPAESFDDFGMLCLMTRGAALASALEVSVVCVAFVAIHAVVLAQGARSRPHSITRRSVGHASRYLFAFLVTYVLYIVYHMEKMFASDAKQLQARCGFQWLQLAGILLSMMNGVFNLWAFLVHCRRIRTHRCRGRVVSFRDEGSLVDITEISHRARAEPRAPRGGAWSQYFASRDLELSDELLEEIGSFLAGEEFESQALPSVPRTQPIVHPKQISLQPCY